MRSFIYLLLVIILSACGGNSGDISGNTPPVVHPPNSGADTPALAFQPVSTGLVHGDAELNGLSLDLLTSSFQMAESQPGLRSLLVVKDQELVAEQYFNGTESAELLHVRSVTKTVTAVLLGVAIEEGVIDSINSTIGEYLLDDYPWLDEQKAAITLEQLLTMSSGFQWNEADGSEFDAWVSAVDPVAYLLERPLVNTPGTRFNYNSAATHLIAVILDKALAGQSESFAITRLFQPLGISDVAWDRLADGLFNGSSGLQLKAIDIAKLGLLLNGSGTWENSDGSVIEIVTAQWLSQMKSNRVQINEQIGSLNLTGYGLLWWFGQHAHADKVFNFQLAWGWGGQFILTEPENDLIIVANNDWFVDAQLSDQQVEATLAIILDGILEAIK